LKENSWAEPELFLENLLAANSKGKGRRVKIQISG